MRPKIESVADRLAAHSLSGSAPNESVAFRRRMRKLPPASSRSWKPRRIEACAEGTNPIFTQGVQMPYRKPAPRLACAAVIVLASLSNPAGAQSYPTKALRLIVSSAPQGGTDTIARIAAATLSETLGQQVVVENRPGANGQIAVAMVAKAPPDGYTLLMSGAASMVIHPHTYAKLPYDVAGDFAPVSLMASSDYILA